MHMPPLPLHIPLNAPDTPVALLQKIQQHACNRLAVQLYRSFEVQQLLRPAWPHRTHAPPVSSCSATGLGLRPACGARPALMATCATAWLRCQQQQAAVRLNQACSPCAQQPALPTPHSTANHYKLHPACAQAEARLGRWARPPVSQGVIQAKAAPGWDTLAGRNWSAPPASLPGEHRAPLLRKGGQALQPVLGGDDLAAGEEAGRAGGQVRMPGRAAGHCQDLWPVPKHLGIARLLQRQPGSHVQLSAQADSRLGRPQRQRPALRAAASNRCTSACQPWHASCAVASAPAGQQSAKLCPLVVCSTSQPASQPSRPPAPPRAPRAAPARRRRPLQQGGPPART